MSYFRRLVLHYLPVFQNSSTNAFLPTVFFSSCCSLGPRVYAMITLVFSSHVTNFHALSCFKKTLPFISSQSCWPGPVWQNHLSETHRINKSHHAACVLFRAVDPSQAHVLPCVSFGSNLLAFFNTWFHSIL